FISLWMDKTYIISSGTFSNSTWGEANPLFGKPFYSKRQIIDPKTDMIQFRFMDFGTLSCIYGLHDINFYSIDSLPHRENVFIDVFFLRTKTRLLRETHDIYPKFS